MICNPHAVGGATSRGRGVASGVGAGADDVQGLPFFLDILSTVKISRAKNPEGFWPSGPHRRCVDVGPFEEGLGVVFTGAKRCHRAR
jgi:hypothetical protein